MHQALDALEPRQLLAFDQSFTDVDGDTYRIEVIGNGTAAVTTSVDATTGFIQNLTVSGTDEKSTLRVTMTTVGGGGDGRVGIQNLSASILRSAAMAEVDARPSSNVVFDNVGQLVFGNVGDDADLDVSLNAPVLPSLGTRTAALRNVGDNPTVRFGTRLATLSINNAADVNLIFLNGAGTVTAVDGFAVDIASDAGIDVIKVGGAAAITGTIGAAVKSISAHVFLDAGGPLRVLGRLGTLSSTTANYGQFEAHHYGTVSGTVLAGTLFASTPDAAGVAFKTVKFANGVNGGFLVLSGGGTPGRVNTLTTGPWTNGTLIAGSVKTMKVTGDWVFSTMVLLGAPAGLTLGSMSITGAAIGSMEVRGDMGALKFGAVGSGNTLELNDNGTSRHIKSITIAGNVNATIMNLQVGSVGAITVGNHIAATSILLTAADRTALGSLKVTGNMVTSTITTHAAQGIGSIRAPGLNTVTIDTASIGTLTLAKTGVNAGMINSSVTLRGADAKGFALRSADFGVGGFDSDVDAVGSGVLGALRAIELNNIDISGPRIGSVTVSGPAAGAAVNSASLDATDPAPGGFSIGRVDIRGDVEFTNVRAVGSIDRFSAARITSSYISAGSSAQNTLPADLTGFIDARINRFTITGAFDPGAFAFNSTRVVAATIGVINVAGRINTTGLDDGGETFGFGARTFGAVTLKSNAGATFKPVIGAAPGDVNVFAPDPSGNFLIRVYA